MRVRRAVALCSLVLGWFVAGPARSAERELTVFAAASLSEALSEIGAGFEAETDTRVAFNFGASSALARQIEAGAPADLFVSADAAKVDALANRGLVDPATRRELLSNRLVIVVAAENGVPVAVPADLATAKVRVLALAEPRSVPAGIYSREFLLRAGLWEKVSAKVVPTENVRGALAAVESGNADAAIVYATDAGRARRVRVAVEIPAADAPRIVYVAAVPTDAESAPGGRRFLDYLGGAGAAAVFRRHGFAVLPPASP